MLQLHAHLCPTLRPSGRQPARLLCPWDCFFRQEYWLGCHTLLQEIFPTQGSIPRLMHLLHWKVDSLSLCVIVAKLRLNPSSRLAVLWLCCAVLGHFSHVRVFAILWTVACQVPLSMGFSRQEYWSGLPFLSPGDLPDIGKGWIKCTFLHTLQNYLPSILWM